MKPLAGQTLQPDITPPLYILFAFCYIRKRSTKEGLICQGLVKFAENTL